MLKKTAILIPALLAVLLNGCGIHNYSEVKDADMVDVSYNAAKQLQAHLSRTLPKHSLIIVSTLLNVDNLNKTSAFGRIISDQIASSFHQSGYQIIGMELPLDLFIMNEDGSLKLSDAHKALLKHYQAGVIVGGVYAAGKKNAYVSLRIVDLKTKNLLSSTDLSLPMGPDAKKLMLPKDVGSTGARAPTSTAASENTPVATTENDSAQIDEQEPTDNSMQ